MSRQPQIVTTVIPCTIQEINLPPCSTLVDVLLAERDKKSLQQMMKNNRPIALLSLVSPRTFKLAMKIVPEMITP